VPWWAEVALSIGSLLMGAVLSRVTARADRTYEADRTWRRDVDDQLRQLRDGQVANRVALHALAKTTPLSEEEREAQRQRQGWWPWWR
jgi:hypothetical protein